MSKISVKRDYLYWFLDTQRLKWPSTGKVLEYIIKNDHILERIELVDDIRYYRNALMISGRGTATFPFVLRLDGRYIHDVEEAIQVLSSTNYYKLYVKLSYSCAYNLDLIPGSRKMAYKVIETSRKSNRVSYHKIMDLIDAALDQRNREEFQRLTNHLKKIKKA